MNLIDNLTGAVLRRLSHDSPESGTDVLSPEDARRQLDAIWPGVIRDMKGTRVLDFGCGRGAHTVALASIGAQAVGLDIQPRLLAAARDSAGDVPVRFTDHLEEGERFDWILSVNSMEHFADPYSVLMEMKRRLAPQGSLLITFCPTWLSPYGAHMHYFTKVPWVHLIFPERVVMDVRSHYKSDGARRYEDVEGGLNKMTVFRFQRLIEQVGLSVHTLNVEYVKGQRWASRVPVVKELLANRVTATLGLQA